MRIKSFARNTAFGLMFEIVGLIFGIIVPRLIISTYGSAINGLTSTIIQILLVLNLLQAGALGASIFSLYKPLAENDFEKVSKILATSRIFFIKAGIIFLIGTFIIAPIATYFMLDSDIDSWLIMASFFILGLNTSFSFFFTSKYDIVFSADQKRYILSISGIIERISYYFILFYIIINNYHFIFMYIAIIIGSFIKIIYLEWQYTKRYKDRIVKVKVGKIEKIKDRQYVMYSQLGFQSVAASPIIIISAFYDLKVASVYAVYNLIQTIILKPLDTVYNSVGEVFGNLVASGNVESINKVSNLLQFLYITLGTCLLMVTIFLTPSFINLYIGRIADINYSYPLLVVTMTLHLISYCMYQPIKNLINSYGLFKEIYLQSVVSAFISLFISILLGKISMPYVMLGPTMFYLLITIYQIYVLKKKISWLDLSKFPSRILMMISSVSVSFLGYCLIKLSIVTWSDWVVTAFFVTLISVNLILIYSFIFERKELKQSFDYITMLVNKKAKWKMKGVK